MTSFLLLLGAGFSRNWGGWLAAEAFEYLIGSPKIDPHFRELLWKHRVQGGFEAALAQVQMHYLRSPKPLHKERLEKFQAAISQMFDDMDKAFQNVQFEFQKEREYLVARLLTRFDAIFTLNQDLLLERHYLGENVSLLSDGRWTGWQLPGMIPPSIATDPLNRFTGTWRPDPAGRSITGSLQPIIKLHGSSNWADENEGSLLVMGGNKPEAINEHPVLKWNHEQFGSLLAGPNTRVMVIGYGFRDEHINRIIIDAAKRGGLRGFIIDPRGIDALDTDRPQLTDVPGELMKTLAPYLTGASRRSLREICGSDRVEYGKVMRFFA